jgi:hypothetical protein
MILSLLTMMLGVVMIDDGCRSTELVSLTVTLYTTGSQTFLVRGALWNI